MHKTPDSHTYRQPAPDQRPLSAIQARRLSGLTGIAAKELAGAHVADLAGHFGARIDNVLTRFEFVCGRIVKTDPHTGVDSPVPFATVHVYDVDCSFFGYFPNGWPWSWLFPIHCEREELATLTTDACGNFCTLVWRFDIDWIRRWRFERICYPEIFHRPTVGDVIEQTAPRFPRPNPGDPLKLSADGGMTFRRLSEVLGTQRAERLLRMTADRTIGGDATAYRRLMAEAAFPTLPPPLQAHLYERFDTDGPQALARHLGLDAAAAARFDLSHYAGPFLRCRDILVPEWVPILSVPDIAFKVTQNIAGVDETIYDNSHFDIDWESGDLSNVTLHARPNAVATLSCDVPDVDCSVQGILFAGLMPLDMPYHDSATGCALRPNRPHPDGSLLGASADPSNAPYTGTLQLFGCNHAPGASFYRIHYTYQGDTDTVFTGVTWPIHPFAAGTPTPNPNPKAIPDSEGWYTILTDGAWHPDHLLFEWTTGATGTYELWLEYADAAKIPLAVLSDRVKLAVDNAEIYAQFTDLRWRPIGGSWSSGGEFRAGGTPDLTCPVIRRPLSGGKRVDLEVQVSYSAATTYLRSVELTAGNCGGGGMDRDLPSSPNGHWYETPTDNSFTTTETFTLAGSADQGAYSFMLSVASRAFNPAGGDGGHGLDWRYDPVYHIRPVTLPVAVVDVGS